eukprot:1636834-Prymnesium_polylepis.1
MPHLQLSGLPVEIRLRLAFSGFRRAPRVPCRAVSYVLNEYNDETRDYSTGTTQPRQRTPFSFVEARAECKQRSPKSEPRCATRLSPDSALRSLSIR